MNSLWEISNDLTITSVLVSRIKLIHRVSTIYTFKILNHVPLIFLSSNVKANLTLKCKKITWMKDGQLHFPNFQFYLFVTMQHTADSYFTLKSNIITKKKFLWLEKITLGWKIFIFGKLSNQFIWVTIRFIWV